MPTLRPRHFASLFSLILRSSWPANTTRPEVGRSMPVRILSSVDLPLPDGPLMAKRLPGGIENEIESRITARAALFAITLEMFSTRTCASVCVRGGEISELSIDTFLSSLFNLILTQRALPFGNPFAPFEDDPAGTQVDGGMHDEPEQTAVGPGGGQGLTIQFYVAQYDDALRDRQRLRDIRQPVRKVTDGKQRAGQE